MSKRMILILLCLSLAGWYAISNGRTKSDPLAETNDPSVETAATAETPSEDKSRQPDHTKNQAKREAPAQIQPPSLSEAQDAVKRMFGKTVLIDESRKPSYFTGDFNGDSRQDLAVIVKPAPGMLAEINSEVANWIIQDPLRAPMLNIKNLFNRVQVKPVRAYAEQSDLLLALIHGYGLEGWRSRETTQAYLLRHAVGANLRTLSRKELLKAINKEDSLPNLVFDVISETIDNRPGLLVWTGAKYAWYRMPDSKDELALNNNK
jgi:hypothetical protein